MILNAIWDFLETIFGGLIDGISSIFSVIVTNLSTFIDVIADIFTFVPDTVGKFGSLLKMSLWFLPAGFYDLLVFAILICVVVAIVKLIRG